LIVFQNVENPNKIWSNHFKKQLCGKEQGRLCRASMRKGIQSAQNHQRMFGFRVYRPIN
jgi:hypothetical protein